MTKRTTRRGFTLIELMVVVVLVAILATVAVASYKKYQRNARVNEGVAHVSDIRMKQETFFATYSRYLSSTNDETIFARTPLTGTGTGFYQFANNCPQASNVWCNLGFEPPGMTVDSDANLFYFQFQTMGWAPGGPTAPVPPYPAAPTDRWLMVRAQGLQDVTGQCTTVTHLHNVPELIILRGECID